MVEEEGSSRKKQTKRRLKHKCEPAAATSNHQLFTTTSLFQALSALQSFPPSSPNEKSSSVL